MVSEADDSPPVEENKDVVLQFELKFNKVVDIVSPDSCSLHELRIRRYPKEHELICLGPLELSHDPALRNDNDEAIRTWIDNRALLSVAIAFVDAEFAKALQGNTPYPPHRTPKRPKLES